MSKKKKQPVYNQPQSNVEDKGTLTLAWCDNGMSDGKFAEGMVSIALQAPANGIPISYSIRVQGNQIGRQRQALFDHWADNLKSDWILWVDSDIVIDIETLCKIWDTADAKLRPIVSGVYFISKEPEGMLSRPLPAIFYDNQEANLIHVHPLPENQVIRIDSAGMGLVLMHRSIVEKLRKEFPNQSLFAEQEGLGDKFVGEDIVFFRNVKKVGIPVYAHTGALVKHMKRFSMDYDYYSLYWGMVHLRKQMLEKTKE